jgi:hypothetical protein
MPKGLLIHRICTIKYRKYWKYRRYTSDQHDESRENINTYNINTNIEEHTSDRYNERREKT